MPKRGGRRKKNRTHVDPEAVAGGKGLERVPRSFVVKRGRVDITVSELVEDLRKVMLPHTAKKLRERKSNTLKDYANIAGPLMVTHLLMLTQTDSAVNLRIGRFPRGPTLTFKILKYSLMRHVRSIQKNPVDPGLTFGHAPLAVLNNFNNATKEGAKHLSIVTVMLQNMFPAINILSTKLSDCTRVVLFHYNEEAQQIELRHYAIRTDVTGVSKSVKSIVRTKVPDLSNLDDISEFILNQGAASDSEHEDAASKVTVMSSRRRSASKRAIRLAELGPRMTLQLVKIQGGLGNGDVLYHAFVKKTPEEIAKLKAEHEEKNRLRAERRAKQEANVQRKKEAAEALKAAKAARREARKAAAENGEEVGESSGEEGPAGFGQEDDGSSGEEDDGFGVERSDDEYHMQSAAAAGAGGSDIEDGVDGAIDGESEADSGGEEEDEEDGEDGEDEEDEDEAAGEEVQDDSEDESVGSRGDDEVEDEDEEEDDDEEDDDDEEADEEEKLPEPSPPKRRVTRAAAARQSRKSTTPSKSEPSSSGKGSAKRGQKRTRRAR